MQDVIQNATLLALMSYQRAIALGIPLGNDITTDPRWAQVFNEVMAVQNCWIFWLQKTAIADWQKSGVFPSAAAAGAQAANAVTQVAGAVQQVASAVSPVISAVQAAVAPAK